MTSPTLHNEVLGIMESVTRRRLRKEILASPYNALIFDEARLGTKAMYAGYLPVAGKPREVFWAMSPEPPRDASLDLKPAVHIAKHVCALYDGLGDNFWGATRGLTTDGCSLMRGEDGGVQRFCGRRSL